MNEEHRRGDGSPDGTPETDAARRDYAAPSSSAVEHGEETRPRAESAGEHGEETRPRAESAGEHGEETRPRAESAGEHAQETHPSAESVGERGEEARTRAEFAAREEARRRADLAGERRAETHTSRDRAQRSELQEHLLSKTTWLRFLHIVLFLILWGISRIVIGAVIVLQFFWVLFSGARNPRLSEVGQSFATYTYELVLYLTYASDRRPFPFADWPAGPPRGAPADRPWEP